jgi:hypothetical protein
MSRHRGYVYEDESGNRMVSSLVRNLSFENLEYEGIIPSSKIIGWFCTKPCSAMPMDLLPIERNKQPEYWQCRSCRKQVSVQERDKVFEIIMKNVLEKYNKEVEIFTYDRQTNKFEILGIYEGKSHHTSKRRLITKGNRAELINQLLTTCEDTLGIECQNIKGYFVE